MVMLSACAEPVPLKRERVETLAALEYPQKADRGEPIDIAVAHKHRGSVTIINRTARAYEGVQLWLNQQYVRRFARIGVGETRRVSLRRFVNRHGEGFPVGSIIAPEDAAPVISAELYRPDAQRIHALPVRLREDWDRFY